MSTSAMFKILCRVSHISLEKLLGQMRQTFTSGVALSAARHITDICPNSNPHFFVPVLTLHPQHRIEYRILLRRFGELCKIPAGLSTLLANPTWRDPSVFWLWILSTPRFPPQQGRIKQHPEQPQVRFHFQSLRPLRTSLRTDVLE